MVRAVGWLMLIFGSLGTASQFATMFMYRGIGDRLPYLAVSVLFVIGGFWLKGPQKDAATATSFRPMKRCPKCATLLKGITADMIGDTGVCPRCKAEFEITTVGGEREAG